MMTSTLHFLLVAGVSVAMAMPEFISPDNWEPHPSAPPTLPPPGPVATETHPPEDMEAHCQMLLEGPAHLTSDQVPWFCLCVGCPGSSGPKGSWGDQGLSGSPGRTGQRGGTGFSGPPGFMGRPGVKGQKGDEGNKGVRGVQGITGTKGGPGNKGAKGEPGGEGVPGDQGQKGDDDVCPETCESSLGPPGPPGLPGPGGPQGLSGSSGQSGTKGVKGDTGDQGDPGVDGSTGERGEPGLKGDCLCSDGAEGGRGQKGEPGQKGDQGIAGQMGQKGVQGSKGDTGIMGMMGQPGPCMPSVQSAFSAGLTSSLPSPNAPVVFSRVLYNVQGSYDPGSGLFTAPANGTYVFSIHLTVHQRVLKVGLFHNFVPIVKITDTKDLGTTSHCILLHLAQGDRVWVQVKDSFTNGMFAGSESSSTFTGFLLHPDTCNLPSPRGPRTPGPPTAPEGPYSWDYPPGSG